MADAFAFRMRLGALVVWLNRRQQDAVAYLTEENRILRGRVHSRIRFTDEERRRVAMHGVYGLRWRGS